MTQPTNTVTRSPFLQSLYDERHELEAFIERTVAGAMTGGTDGARRDLSQTEQETLTRTRTRIGQLDDQIQPLEEFEQLRSAGDASARNHPVRPTPAAQPGAGEGRTALGMRVETRVHNYRTRGECIVDQLRAAPQNLGGQSDQAARERLLSAGVIYAGISDADIAVARANARDAANRLAQDPTQARVTQVTGDTPGILPVPIIGEVMNDVDAARPFIDSLGAKGLAFTGETFKRPVITQHSAVGKQTTQATTTGVGTQKLVIGSVTFTKETWGGYLDVSRQDIDWTSPAAWDAILNDLQEQYALQTENAAADAFAAAVVASVEVVGAAGIPGGGDLKAWITALYGAAALAYTGGGRLPDKIWASLDMWSGLGPLIESQVSTNQQPGSSSVGSFTGDLLKLPRVVVPSFPNGTLIIGVSRWSEVYEERIGLLTAVLPSVFGVQVAYGGYVAYNTLKAGAFAKVVNIAA
ncbi:phage major capsid protein [Phytohabitans rumicis]|uniref:Phage capsid protein n=1 Tax=Phytohabitans rumicis TaxID=1076125 RepID=A0A6V8L9A6_9ACTN|nr:hypothetical protein [Phytohabitans rumicis]GFJ91578.1 hypothetical protein Prum_052200 [Phytohabitans rumicis]